jgi:glycosyltransferase involved in cell wall biosynthesis
MNILIAVTHLKAHGDGISHYAFTLASGLQQRGHRVWLASSNPAPPAQLATAQARHLLLPVDQYRKNLPNALTAMRLIRQVAQQERLDLIHSLHRWIGFLSHYALWGLPTQLVSTDQNILHGKQRLTRWGRRVISVSQTGRDHLIHYFGVPADKITVIYNAVEVTPPTPAAVLKAKQDLLLADDDLVLANVARLDPQKGQQYLLEAMPALLARWSQVKLVIAGDGPLEAALKEQAHSLGIAARVIFAGVRPDVPAILANAQLFVLSSLWEGLSFAMLEAMALGLPVVVTNVGGAAEVITPGQTGLLVEPANVHSLTENLLLLLENETLRQTMARAGQQRVQQQFRAQTMIDQTEAVYRQVCGL